MPGRAERTLLHAVPALELAEALGARVLSPAHALARAAGIVARVVRVALLVLLELLRGECDVPRGLELLRDVLRRRGLREARGGRARRLGLPRRLKIRGRLREGDVFLRGHLRPRRRGRGGGGERRSLLRAGRALARGLRRAVGGLCGLRRLRRLRRGLLRHESGFRQAGDAESGSLRPARVRGVVAHVHERHGVRFECAAVGYADGQRGTSTGNVRKRDGCGVRRDVRGARMPRRVTEPRQLPSKNRGSPFPGMHRENASDGLTTV